MKKRHHHDEKKVTDNPAPVLTFTCGSDRQHGRSFELHASVISSPPLSLTPLLSELLLYVGPSNPWMRRDSEAEICDQLRSSTTNLEMNHRNRKKKKKSVLDLVQREPCHCRAVSLLGIMTTYIAMSGVIGSDATQYVTTQINCRFQRFFKLNIITCPTQHVWNGISHPYS